VLALVALPSHTRVRESRAGRPADELALV
jgi:hypothetical protein